MTELKRFNVSVKVCEVDFKEVDLNYYFSVDAEDEMEASDRADDVVKHNIEADLENSIKNCFLIESMYISEVKVC